MKNRSPHCVTFLLPLLALTGCGDVLSDPLAFLTDNPRVLRLLADASQRVGNNPPAFTCGPNQFSRIVPDCPFGFVCFTEACVAHDACYRTCGATQQACDVLFFNDILSICYAEFSATDERLVRCQALAFVYFTAVSQFGQESFDVTQQTHCTAP